jgi:hypothetical protein
MTTLKYKPVISIQYSITGLAIMNIHWHQHIRIIQNVKKKGGLQALRGYSTQLNEQKVPVNVCPETNAC